MDTNHRFSVKKVLETNVLSEVSKEKDVTEENIPELEQGNVTYPVVSNDPKIHRNSLAQLTREALPRLDNYRDCVHATRRPSLGELYGEPSEGKVRKFKASERTQEPEGNRIKISSYFLSSL
jgi:hypothetical protein